MRATRLFPQRYEPETLGANPQIIDDLSDARSGPDFVFDTTHLFEALTLPDGVTVVDRYAHLIVVVALASWALGFIPGKASSPLCWIGLIPIVTVFVGYCPT